MRLESSIQNCALNHNTQRGAVPQGNFSFYPVDNMSEGLVIDEPAHNTCNFIYQMRFQIFIKRRFQGGRASSYFFCGERDLNIKRFF